MEYLASSYFFDFESEPIQQLVAPWKNNQLSDQQKAIELYTKVRDHWRYDPYNISLAKSKYQSSYIALQETGNCINKSILLISGLRALGIPARLHLGKVKNHLAVERLTEKFGSNELTPHGMVNVFLNQQWLKMSPAFNRSLCERMQVEPLEFDGKSDSFLQQYNSQGSRFMEYTDDYGHFTDVPLDFMAQNIKQHYPHIFDTGSDLTEFKL